MKIVKSVKVFKVGKVPAIVCLPVDNGGSALAEISYCI